MGTPWVGVVQAMPATIACNVCFSTAINIQGASQLWFCVQTFACNVATTTANMYIQVSDTSTTSTFKRVTAQGMYSGGSGILDWESPSSVGAKVYECGVACGMPWMRLEISNTLTGAVQCTVFVGS